MGITAVLRLILITIIMIVIAGGLWYAINLKADLAVSEANNAKLQDAIGQQSALIASMQADIQQIQAINNDLAQQNERQRRDVETLNSKFSKRDFGALAAERPATIERLINRGTVNAMRCLELASGAPLTEAEKNAKTPMEANRECPNLIDGNYTAPVR